MRPSLIALAAAFCCTAVMAPLSAQQPTPIGPSDTVLVLADSALIVEDLTFDARTASWYLSSVHERKIVRVGLDGVAHDFVPTGGSGLWAAFALALDQPRNRLWVASGADAQGAGSPPAEIGRTAVFAFDLATGALAARYELTVEPGKTRTLADLALLSDGTLAVSDSRGGGFYALDPATGAFTPLVPQGTFHSPQAPAEIAGGKAVLVADYARGIAKVDRATGMVTWLTLPDDLYPKGFDGMRLRGTTLIAVQNGSDPHRVIRMELDSAVTRVVSWKVLAAGAPALAEPTHGVLRGGNFIYIANSGWDHVGGDGSLTDVATLRPTVIRRLKLSP